MVEGDLYNLRERCLPYLKDDPRDLIREAEEKAGNPGHWFSIPFDEMENFSGELPATEKEESKDNNLPF